MKYFDNWKTCSTVYVIHSYAPTNTLVCYIWFIKVKRYKTNQNKFLSFYVLPWPCMSYKVFSVAKRCLHFFRPSFIFFCGSRLAYSLGFSNFPRFSEWSSCWFSFCISYVITCYFLLMTWQAHLNLLLFASTTLPCAPNNNPLLCPPMSPSFWYRYFSQYLIFTEIFSIFFFS